MGKHTRFWAARVAIEGGQLGVDRPTGSCRKAKRTKMATMAGSVDRRYVPERWSEAIPSWAMRRGGKWIPRWKMMDWASRGEKGREGGRSWKGRN